MCVVVAPAVTLVTPSLFVTERSALVSIVSVSEAVLLPGTGSLTPLETVAVFVHLSSGERIWAGRFDSDALAEQRAIEIVRALNRPEPGVWAKFGNRLIRPGAVVSIELAPRREDA